MTTANDIVKAITRAKFRVQPEQLQQLAREHYQHAAGVVALHATYLKCLVAAVKATTGAGDGKEEILGTIDSTHASYIPHIEAGVTTQEIEDDERLPKDERRRRKLETQRRATFARSSKSELRAYVDLGGDIHSLEPALVTRTVLREYINGKRNEENVLPEGLQAETKVGQQLELSVVGSFARIVKAVERLATVRNEDPSSAMQLIRAMQDRLDELLGTIAKQAGRREEVKEIRQMPVRPGEKRGDLTLWPSNHH